MVQHSEESKEGLKYQALSMVKPFSLSSIRLHRTDIELSEDYTKGDLEIDAYVTHRRPFSEINDGFHDMHVSGTE